MSRNLCRTDCVECPGGHEHIVIEGPIRPVTEKEDPGYFRDHAGLLIAEARCILCHTLYVAWVDWPGQSHSYWHLSSKVDGQRFCDLSYRHAFNDEPSAEDTPLFRVEAVVTYVRTPMHLSEHSYRRWRGEAPEWHRQGIARWLTRDQDVMTKGLSIGDELAALQRDSAAKGEP